MRTLRPATPAAGTRQAQTGSSSSMTVQAPQSPASQPTFVPVRCSSSRSTDDNRRTGGTSTETAAPLTVKSMRGAIEAHAARSLAGFACLAMTSAVAASARDTISRAAPRR